MGINIGGRSLILDILANASHSVKRVLLAESRAIKQVQEHLVHPVYQNIC